MTLDRAGWVDFRAVKQAVSLAAVLRFYQIPGLRGRGDRLQRPCPLHRGERDDSFRVHLRRNVFHCFACQAQGNVLDFVATLEKCSIREAALRLQQCFSVAAPAGRVGLSAADGERDKLQLVRKKFDLPRASGSTVLREDRECFLLVPEKLQDTATGTTHFSACFLTSEANALHVLGAMV